MTLMKLEDVPINGHNRVMIDGICHSDFKMQHLLIALWPVSENDR